MKLGIWAACSILLTGWSVWRLWFRRRPDLDRRVYTLGVQGFGISGWLLCLLFFSSKIPEAVPAVLLLAPIYLCGGYVWGRIMLLGFSPRR
jgi:hypothetical protein